MAGRGKPGHLEKGENGMGFSGVTFAYITCRNSAKGEYAPESLAEWGREENLT
jgi:hypothetical protein